MYPYEIFGKITAIQTPRSKIEMTISLCYLHYYIIVLWVKQCSNVKCNSHFLIKIVEYDVTNEIDHFFMCFLFFFDNCLF
jgi:hypothetical protein